MVRRLIVVTLTVLVVLAGAAAAALYWVVSRDAVRVAIEQQASAWLGTPVSIARATPRIFPRPGIVLENVTAGGGLMLGRVELSSPLLSLLARRLENADLMIADSRVAMPLPFALPSQERRRGAPEAAGGGNPPLRVVSIRSIGLRNVTLVSRGHEVKLDAEASLLRTQLQLRRLTVASPITALEVTGIVELQPSVDARLRVRGDRLDVDELLAIAAAFSPPPGENRTSSETTPTRIAARVSVESATAGGIAARQFATELQVTGDQVVLSPLTFQMFDGRFQGAAEFRLGRSLQAALQARVVDVDVARLAEFGGLAGTITGRLSGRAAFSAAGGDMTAVLASARGSGDAAIARGTVAGLNLVRTVVAFFGRPTAGAPAASDAFETLNARFTVADQVLTGNALSLHSRDADIVGEGTLALATSALSGRFDLSLSEALSSQAGTDLARYTREGSRVVLPATLGGTLRQPRLAIDTAAALNRGLRNEVQRRLGELLGKFGQSPD